MRKGWLVGLILVAAVLLTGCDGRVLVRLDVPIVIEPAPPKYRAEIDGYISYDDWIEHVAYTKGRKNDRYYEPLVNAKVTVEETGKYAYTDRYGYFHIDGVPNGRITLSVSHHRLRRKIYFETRANY